MKTSIHLFRAACALAVLAASSSAQEIARDVPPGREVREHKLLTLGKTDRWDLEVSKGEVLLCRVNSQAFDPVLRLTDNAGKVLAENDGRGTQSEIWYRMKAAGKIAFRVSGYEGAGGGQYTFWMQRFKTEDTAPGRSHTHKFGVERWWNYAVELRKGDVLVPAVTGSGRLTAVFHEDRTHLGAVYGGYRIRADGLHFVRIEGLHRLECHVRLALARQRDLSTDGELQDTIEPHGLHIWRVRLRAFEPMHLPLAMFDGILQFDLREPNPPPREGPAFAWTGSMDRGGLRRRWLMPRRHTTVELFLKNPHAKAASYTGSLRTVGEALPEGQEVRRTLARCGANLFRLRTKPGELIRLRAKSEMFDAQIQVCDRAGNVLHNNDDTSLADPNPSLTFPVTKPGDHWVLVYCAGATGGGPFDLRMDSLPVAVAKVGEATRVQLGEEPHKYVHLNLERNQDIWLSLRTGNHPTSVHLFAPDGRHLASHSGGGIGRDVLFGRRAEQPGRYTLRIDGGKGERNLRIIRP